ncbi:DJ-1/PfpI family protein [Ilumatobacter sp.]|uniref:DJ-1/PfpI family protein n=1 Tax=Ilumatobacter sp. TaxID=1967498 RepID=UPI003AF693AB
MRVAIVVYDGVLSSECEAFASVLGLAEHAEVLMVGARDGAFSGPGGSQGVDLRFDEIDRVDIAVVPGGLGCERAADDPQLRDFLVRMERSARYVVASSTGSVLLAAAGLLHGHAAATHWLAGDLLRRYGSDVDERRLVATGNVITCEGQISAVEAAFQLVERIDGTAAATRIRATLLERGEPLLRPVPRWRTAIDRVRDLVGGPRPAGSPRSDRSTEEPPVTPLSVMVELVDNEELARELRRSPRRRR